MKTLLLSLLMTLAVAARAGDMLVENFVQNGTVVSPKVASPVWTAETGELVGRHGTAYSDSASLRVFTKRQDFKDVTVSFDLVMRDWNAPSSAQENAWDGFHVRLRDVNEDSHYDLSVNRRDNTIVIKKKAQGTYFTLGTAVPYAVPFNSWQSVKATIHDGDDGSVAIALYVDDALLASAIDNGSIGGPPIKSPGCVGLRSGNAEFDIARFAISTFERAVPKIIASSMTVQGGQATFYWDTDIPASSEVDYGAATAYGATANGGWGTEHVVVVGGLAADTAYHARLRSRTGPTCAVESHDLSFHTAASVDVSSPTVTFTVPAAGQPINGVVGVAATATDDTGVVGVQFFVDGRPLGAEIMLPPYGQTFATSQFADGAHTLTAVARDAAGNHGTAQLPITIGIALPQPAGSASAAPPAGDSTTASGFASGIAAGAGGDGPPAPLPAGTTTASAAPGIPVPVSAPTPGTSPDGARAPERFLTPAVADGINDSAHFGPQAAHVSVFDIRGRKVFDSVRRGAAAIIWNCRDAAGRLVETGVYIVKIIKDGGDKEYQAMAVAK